jgi:hypothetical protein
LHGFRLTIFSGPGCRVEIACPDVPAWTQPAPASPRPEQLAQPSADVVVASS